MQSRHDENENMVDLDTTGVDLDTTGVDLDRAADVFLDFNVQRVVSSRRGSQVFVAI